MGLSRLGTLRTSEGTWRLRAVDAHRAGPPYDDGRTDDMACRCSGIESVDADLGTLARAGEKV